MSLPYVGEIRLFAGNYAPVGWHFCDGSLQSISQNNVLFSLIGTTYGGDGQQTFALPDLRGRVPLHQSPTYVLGQQGGEEQIALTTAQIPGHTHPLRATEASATRSSPLGAILARGSTNKLYDQVTPSQPLAPSAVSPSSGSQPHSNLQPYLAVNFIIALFGVYPTQN